MIHIVTEGPFDQHFIQVALADLAANGSFVVEAYGGRDNGRPVARKHLLQHRDPVIFVIDADSCDLEKAKQQQRDLEDYFRWGGHGLPFQVISFVPTLEVVFFEKHAILERLLGRALDPATKIAGSVAPKQVLDSLLPALGARSRTDLLTRLTASDLREIREQQQIADLRRFVEQHQQIRQAV